RAPGGRGFLGWVAPMLIEREALGRDTLRAHIPDAVAEALRYGTAAVGEVTNTLDAVPALGAAGLRGIRFHELLAREPLAHGGAGGAGAVAAGARVRGGAARALLRVRRADYTSGGRDTGRRAHHHPRGGRPGRAGAARRRLRALAAHPRGLRHLGARALDGRP